jgi:hypothetical protein
MKLLVTRPKVGKAPQMDVHQNARLALACRVRLVERAQADRAKARVARDLGVSTKTVEKGLKRNRMSLADYLAGRDPGLATVRADSAHRETQPAVVN